MRDTWLEQIREQFENPSTGLNDRILKLINQHHPGVPTGEYRWYYGSYNLSIAYHFYDELTGISIVMFRVPIPGVVAFPEEKTRAEVATMLHVAEHTTIRVPSVYHWGTAGDNPTGLDLPFIIMEFIPHSYSLGTLWEDPRLVQRPELKDNIDLVREHLVRQLAKVHIQLYQLHAPSISALDVVGGRGVPGGAPKSFLLNNQITSYHVPESIFAPDITSAKTLSTSRHWHVSIAETYIAGLLFDTDLERDEEDIREKFVGRYLFRQLAKTRKLPQRPDDDDEAAAQETKESFRLWCDDFRPHNVLCNEQGDVQGVIDWEFVYFAPESYAYDPPFWLIMDRDPEAVLENYDIRLAPNEDVASEGGEIKTIGAQGQDEHARGKDDGSKGNRIDFKVAKDIENNRIMFMRTLQQEERELYKERRKASMTGDPLCYRQGDGVTEQLSGLSLQSEEAIPTPLYDRMRRRWEEQRNEFVWNFTHRWDRDEFDGWYWDELDRELGGEWGDYRDRLDLLPQHVKDLMDWFVYKRMEERGQWDPKKLFEAVLGQMDGTGPFVTPIERSTSP